MCAAQHKLITSTQVTHVKTLKSSNNNTTSSFITLHAYNDGISYVHEGKCSRNLKKREFCVKFRSKFIQNESIQNIVF